MGECLVIFSIAAMGSLVRWSADIALRRVALKEARETVQIASKGSWAGMPVGTVDPIVRVGFILACYGAMVLVLVSAVPGALALERTGFAFALLCAGGLVGEISGMRGAAQTPADDEAQSGTEHPDRASRPLSMALALTLNLSIALLTAGQGLIPIVTLAQPTTQATAQTTAQADRLDPVIVIARRSHDLLEEHRD